MRLRSHFLECQLLWDDVLWVWTAAARRPLAPLTPAAAVAAPAAATTAAAARSCSKGPSLGWASHGFLQPIIPPPRVGNWANSVALLQWEHAVPPAQRTAATASLAPDALSPTVIAQNVFLLSPLAF